MPLTVTFDPTTTALGPLSSPPPSGSSNPHAPTAPTPQSYIELGGTVSGSDGVPNVEIFNGTQDLGHALVAADGTWFFASALDGGDYSPLTASASDSSGQASATAPFTFVTGITGQTYFAQEKDYDSSGNLTTISNFLRFGVLASQTVSNSDGSHTIFSMRDGQTLASQQNDTFTGGGSNERFVFDAHFGQDVVTDFAATGQGHDVVSLSSSEFNSAKQVLAHTTMSGGNAVIHVTPQDSITLQGVSKTDLMAHPKDFSFHP